MQGLTRNRTTMAAVGIWALLSAAAPAFAEDPAEDARVREAQNLVEVLARLRTAGDKDGLSDAFGRVVKAHNELRTDAMRGKLQSALGDVLGDEGLGAVCLKAADALGQLNDPAGGWQQLRRHLPGVQEEAVGPFPLRVIQAVGALAPDAALGPLEQLVEKAKDPNVSRHAIQALGKYGWSRKRLRALTSLGDLLVKLRPGGADALQGRGGGRDARERYDFLRGTLTAALNELTGQTLESAEAWIALYKTHKRSPKVLFKVER